MFTPCAPIRTIRHVVVILGLYPMRASRFLLVPFVASLMALASCTETTTGPGVGSGNLLEATVNGTKLTFDVTSDDLGFNTYTVATTEARFLGPMVGESRKSITVRA